jgi:DNA-binding CsgD family transcriptional regulator
VLADTDEIADRAAAWIARIESADNADLARTRPLLTTRLAFARAELARLRAQPDEGQWRRLVTAWTEMSAAYEGAYARWRLATELLEAGAPRTSSTRSEAESLLGEAWSSTREMGAAPLTLEIESLARRARLQLGEAARPIGATGPEADPVDDLGLTSRELDVLRLVAAGCTNGQIGEALYISRKTASVHVSNILRKLDVSSRLQAGAIATRIGLTTP